MKIGFGASQAELIQWAHYNGLAQLARQVFLDRNACGFKKTIKGRPQHDATSSRIKADTRPLLRQAIHYARAARNALLADESSKFEHMRDLARLHMAQAGASRKQPFMEARARSIAGGKQGGRPTSSHAMEWGQSVEKKMQRNTALSRRDAMEWVARAWNAEHDPPIKWTAIRDALIKPK